MLSLQARITWAMFLLTMLSSSIFAFSIYTASEDLEQAVLARILDEESRFMDTQGSTHPGNRQSALLSYIESSQTDPVPLALTTLRPGQHHGVVIGERIYQVLVEEHPQGRRYLTYEISEWEDKEQRVLQVLIAGVIIASALAVLFGQWIARPVVAPIARFAEAVSAIDPRGRGSPLQPAVAGLEIEPIAKAVDGYSERLRGFIEREQAFTASASHELRTPLTVVQGAVDILDEDIDSSRGRRAVDRISRAVREMSEYIDTLMLLAREEAPDQPSAGTRIGELLNHLVEQHGPLAHEQDNGLELRIEHDVWVQAPESLISIVLSNLLRNALQYTRHGRVTVTLTDQRVDIRDTGPGIPQADRQRIFERGYSTRAGGTGMGLFLVRQICERYGWQVQLTTADTGGTIASIRFTDAPDHHPH